MLKEILTPHGSMLPQIALILFVLIALLVGLYVLTDRRRDHRKRMESMPLDDATIPLTEQTKDEQTKAEQTKAEQTKAEQTKADHAKKGQP